MKDLNAFYGQDSDRVLQPGEIMVAYGHARKGFEYPLIKFALSQRLIFLEKSRRSVRKRKNTMENVSRIFGTFHWRFCSS